MDQTKNIAIIPARSGSKGLKDKNIRLLNGKPLLVYSIEAAIASGIYGAIYVSTDSAEYAKIALEYGAEVPFLRSEATSTDRASSWDVVREALNQYEKVGKNFDMVTLLQPTTPLRKPEDIINSYQLYKEKKANAIVSVCEMDHSPLWSNTLPQDLSMDCFVRKEISELPRQELKTYYRINGGIYMVRMDYFNQSDNIYQSGCFAYVMDKKRSVDIDDEFDFRIAEAIITMREED
jgi:CMP-N,N'-diacetyllegionaminic acid synthase